MCELGGERRQVELAVSQDTRQSIRDQRDVQTREPVVLGVRAPLRPVRDRLRAEQARNGVCQNTRRLSHLSHEEHDNLVQSGQDRRDRHGEFVLLEAVSAGVRSQRLRAQSSRERASRSVGWWQERQR